ncbi:MAG: hypothetical protein ACKVUT_05685 [Gaiella sp.]
MSALDFLSAVAVADADGFHPVARSAMDRRFREAGATFEERDGWLLPVSVPGEAEHLAAAGIGDLSHLGKLEVRGAGDLPAAAGVVSYRISPRRSLVLCPGAQTAALHADLASRFELVLDVTAGLTVLAIAGPARRTVLERMTHLHETPSSGEVAHVPVVHVLEVDGALWLVFAQEFAHYLFEVAVDRAAPLGGGPVGVDALGGRS